jgi:UPF0755 protein
MTGKAGRGPRSGSKRRRRKKAEGAGGSGASSSPPPQATRTPVWRLVSVVLGVVAVALSAWLFVIYPAEHGPGTGKPAEVVVPQGASAAQLASLLADAGLIHSPRLFAVWLRASGGAGAIAPGKHLLTDDASPKQLVARLERRPGGGNAHVTFPEGWTRFDMARRLQDKQVCSLRDFLDATTDGTLLRDLGIEADSAEGYLFPATYDFSLDSDPQEIVRRMKHEWDRRWDTLSRAHSSSLNDVMISTGFTIRDVLTLASIVEKEAAVDDERPVIASVFLNRLRDPGFHPRRLESDPTASYGCLVMPDRAASCATFTGKATAAIEHDPDNPYSTYTHEGLPPGPICNPGARALEATMNPASTHYLYFVARGDGHSTFSETFEAHAGAVRDGGRR